MTIRGFIGGWLVLLCVVPMVSAASELTIRPFLIDEVLVPRESVTNTIRLTSAYEHRLSVVFATVHEITVGPDGEIREFVPPVMTDRTNTVTSWAEITRGRIEIPPGEEVSVPLTLHTHPNAEPGVYHMFIGFPEAKNRPRAEAMTLAGDANGVVVKVTVADERTDAMRISAMEVERFITNPTGEQVLVTIDNEGEVPGAPTGELIYYDSRGIEQAAVSVNDAGAVIQPGDQKTFAVAVPLDASVGRFKANVNLRYGDSQQANLYDTTSFFVIPWWYLLLLALGMLGLTWVLLLLFRRMAAGAPHADHPAEVAMYVRDGHEPNPQDHDIDLSQSS